MSAVAWTHWDEAFELAGKCSSSEPGGDKRITFTLTPPLFERALVSLAMEHGWLPKSDPRYQAACRTGRLEWWDGRGRCVVLVREGAAVPFAGIPTPEFLRTPDPYAGQRWVNDPVTGHLIPESIAATIPTPIPEKENQDIKPPLLVGPPPPPPGVDLGPPKVALTEPIKGKGKKK